MNTSFGAPRHWKCLFLFICPSPASYVALQWKEMVNWFLDKERVWEWRIFCWKSRQQCSLCENIRWKRKECIIIWHQLKSENNHYKYDNLFVLTFLNLIIMLLQYAIKKYFQSTCNKNSNFLSFCKILPFFKRYYLGPPPLKYFCLWL